MWLPSCRLLSAFCILTVTGTQDGNLHEDESLVPRQLSTTVANSDFFRRAYHASVVAGNWIYIDGGEISYKSNENVTYQYSTSLLSIDLSQTWTNRSVVIHATPKPDRVPNLVNPSLWYSEQDKLLYAGFAGRVSLFGDAPSPAELELWSLKPDGSGAGSWTQVIGANSSAWGSITRPWRGMQAYGGDSAFVLGGTEDFLTTPEMKAKLDGEVALPGLVQFNMTTKTFSNSSAAGYQTNGTAERGVMQYVPSFGPSGIFIVMGGDYIAPVDLIDFGTISIFDPVSKRWYQQATSGSVPKARIEFCTAGINSTNGTYEIFMYAGWNGNLGAAAIPYDEIYILTIPAFFWIKVKYPAQHPRHGLTCNAVGGSQILTIGGVDTNTALTTQGSGLQLDQATFAMTPDPFTQGLAIFDMTSLGFADRYDASAKHYVWSDPVKQVYAQNLTSNFSSPAIAQLFKVTHFSNVTDPPTPSSNTQSSPSPSPTSSLTPTSKKTSPGAIAGGVIGGLVLLSLMLLFLRRRRRRLEQQTQTNNPDPTPPPGPEGGYYEPPKAPPKGFHEMYANEEPPEMGGGGQRVEKGELVGSHGVGRGELGNGAETRMEGFRFELGGGERGAESGKDLPTSPSARV